MTIERFRGNGRTRALGRHAWLALLAILLLLVVAPAIARAQADTLTLAWTAPGDDGNQGRAASYEVRMSTSPITPGNFGAVPVLTSVPAPANAGTRQSLVVRGLSRSSEYWFVVRTRDDVGNWSDLSNIVRWTWPLDNAPPAAPTGLTAGSEGGKAIRLSWTANSEPTVAGYVVYRAISGEGPWERLNVQPVNVPEYLDDRLPPDVPKVWYQVTATNSAGGESARSAPVQAIVFSNLSRDPIAWRIRSAYPNPSRGHEFVHMPIEVPAAPGDAHLEIVDSGGQRVRRLEVGRSVVGVVEVDWDGRNESGQLCAPGVYRAWLVAPGTRQAVAVARVP